VLIADGGAEAEELNVTITATPGTVLYGVTFGSHDSGLRIEVVSDPAAASTQASLDARAAQLRADDTAKAAALFQKYSDRSTWHRDGQGRKIWDVYVGVENGPVALLGMFPRRVEIKKGQTVQYHFDYEGMEHHNVVLPFNKGVNILNNTFLFMCDPDGAGTGADQPPLEGEAFPPECPEGTVLEIQLHPKEIVPAGNGVFTGGSDFENSGIRSLETLQNGFFSESPWNLKFREVSPDKGFRYLCTVHGPGLMGGRVVVTN
jgi:plastocyanin